MSKKIATTLLVGLLTIVAVGMIFAAVVTVVTYFKAPYHVSLTGWMGLAVGVVYSILILWAVWLWWQRHRRGRFPQDLRSIGEALLKEEDPDKRKELWWRANLRVFELESEIAKARAEIAKAEDKAEAKAEAEADEK